MSNQPTRPPGDRADVPHAVADPGSQSSQFPTQAAEGSSAPEATNAPAPPVWQLSGSRYQVVGEIGRGGMGVVLRAIDTDIGRPLAIKLMLRKGDALTTERFLAEARITGQLQHPGIPPVHEIGRLADGRPFFAMKLIAGRTLAELLRERAGPQAELPRFLKIFEQIAQTLAYAHAQGVIHRDLKPPNVMVGAFGEVQVMDWGLARRLRGEPPLPSPPAAIAPADAGAEAAQTITLPPGAELVEAEIPSLTEETQAATPPAERPTDAAGKPDSDSGRLTQAGTVLGTPAYMPPEQARGEIDALDVRCDVFGLGAILCVILTGEPPYRGADRPTTFRSARRGDLADAYARLDACGADEQLVALCRQCLSADPADRPPHAGQVASGVTAYLASVQERLEQARMRQAAAEVRAIEERKRWWVTMAWSLTTVVAISLGTGAWLWWKADRATRLAEAAVHAAYVEHEVVSALDEAQRQQQELHSRLRDERRAAQLLSELEEWRALLASAQAAWKRADALAASDRDALPTELLARLASLDGQLQADERDRVLAFELDKIRFESSSPVDGEISLWRAAPKLTRVFQEAGYHIDRDDPAQSAAQIRRATLRLPLVAALDFWALVTRDDVLRGRLLEVARRADPDPWRDRVRQADDWQNADHLGPLAREADLAHQSPQLLAAVAQRLRLTGGDAPGLLRRALVEHPRDFWLYFELGHASHDPVEQAGAFRAALSVRPESVYAYYGLGVVHFADHKLAEAEACYRRAVALDPNYASAYVNLGLVLERLDQPEKAIECYHKALEIDSKHVLALVNLGSALYSQQKLDEAHDCLQRALEIDPRSSAALNNLGLVYREQKKLDEAVVSYRRAVEISPDNAMAWCNLGHVLRQQGKLAEALPAFQQGHKLGSAQPGWTYPSAEWLGETERFIALDAKLPAVLRGEVSPADAREWLDLAELCVLYKKRFGDAARFYARAFAADRKLADDPSTGHRYNAACAAALAAAGKSAGAEKVTEEQAARWRQQARDWLRLDLAAWTEHLRTKPNVRPMAVKALNHWLTDPDLESVREEAALSKLPPGERPAWRQLWADASELAKPAGAAAPRANP